MDQPVHELPTAAWPPGLTRVPYGVYRDAEVARDEQSRVFEGPGWHYLCLEVDVPDTGDYRTTMIGAMPVVVARAEDGEIVSVDGAVGTAGGIAVEAAEIEVVEGAVESSDA